MIVVDDEEVVASTLAMILRQDGFSVVCFSNPLEALKAARFEAPDILISDVVMPDLSGIELARQVRKHCPNCKVVLLSGQSATLNLLETARTDGQDFELLQKPMHPADLLEKLHHLTESWSSPPTADNLQA